ncbi:hypothetical protein B0T18DRAFT_426953 [Schizothecium vesticola]|uniref:Developmental regulatory protein wetA n=1 Tax=Schizothecium vesticola TaxID=314040 RepID=A0AA40KB65_9PEZI|nr:hypothetical protein B0T18DRAFT_426953 [Schizothecium vesticola]
MASLRGMPYSTSEFSPHENKGADLFWMPESPGKPAPADFFDEFVVLDGGDSTTTSITDGGEGGGLARAITPPAVSMPAGRHVNIKQEPDQKQYRQGRGGHPMDAHHMDMMDMGGLPLHYHDMLGAGSISDSELLKLEGLSMRSPRVHVPPSSVSMPPSPPSMSRPTSPRKAGRLEALYTRARNKVATFQGKARAQQPETVAPSQISRAQMGPAKSSSRPRPTGSKAPISPPLTASMPEGMAASLTSTDAAFINGFISDPFADAHMHNRAMPNTPLHTPLMNGSFDTNGAASMNPWDMPTPDMAHSFHGAAQPSFWWGDPFATHPNSSMPHLDMEMNIDDPEFFNTSSSTKPSSQLTMAPHQSFSSSTSNLSLSGLMIHMPQPRGGGPPPAVLHPARYHYPPPPLPPSGPATSPRRLTKAPRAPSSGARRHHCPPNPCQQQQPSPRKPRTASGGHPSVPSSPTAAGPPPSRLHRRSASMQMLRSTAAAVPEPSTPSSSSAIRKRKSWTGRRTSSHHHQQHLENTLLSSGSPRKPPPTSRRTPSLPAMGTSYHHHGHYNLNPQHSTGMHDVEQDDDEEEEDEQPTEDGFVNYTPQDHRVLMTGVAPSGSSKTKARREREAQEQKRKLGEAVRKAVAAAGGM